MKWDYLGREGGPPLALELQLDYCWGSPRVPPLSGCKKRGKKAGSAKWPLPHCLSLLQARNIGLKNSCTSRKFVCHVQFDAGATTGRDVGGENKTG